LLPYPLLQQFSPDEPVAAGAMLSAWS